MHVLIQFGLWLLLFLFVGWYVEMIIMNGWQRATETLFAVLRLLGFILLATLLSLWLVGVSPSSLLYLQR
jgi:hypothetical protein